MSEVLTPQIEIRGLSKVYPIPGGEVHALTNINLTIEKGDIYGIIGMSGAGKSTLIRCLNRLDTPTDGQILIDGENILAMSKPQLRATRRPVFISRSSLLCPQGTSTQRVFSASASSLSATISPTSTQSSAQRPSC